MIEKEKRPFAGFSPKTNKDIELTKVFFTEYADVND